VCSMDEEGGTTMKLTKQQEQALASISKWLKESSITPENWLFTISGFAGTGKTTLLQHLINGLGDKPICCAPTGKAASVLSSKLPGISVQTIHQILYKPNSKNLDTLDKLVSTKVAYIAENPTPDVKIVKRLDTEIAQEKDRIAAMKVYFSMKENTEKLRNKLIFIDEGSMVSKKMLEDFSRVGCKVLMVGDPFQLPPVNSQSWFAERSHDANLTEVMRQALDSPIIRLSMQIRDRHIELSDFTSGDCVLCTKDKLSPDDWLNCDQVLTGSNNSRQRINRFFRKRLGFEQSELPVAGEKMICLKNDHYRMPCWINGVQFRTNADCGITNEGHIGLFAEYEGVHFNGQEFYEYDCLSHYKKDAEKLDITMRDGLFECDYAYAITCHKSQGSEWDSVIVADDKMREDDKEFRAKWLYTAVTRAKKKLIVTQ
jgi:exodeoxyribonuclease-5